MAVHLLPADPRDEGRASGFACSSTHEDRERQIRIEAKLDTILCAVVEQGAVQEGHGQILDQFRQLLAQVPAQVLSLVTNERPNIGERSQAFYTVDEVAEILNVAPYTVREWLKQGKLAGQKKGASEKSGWLISREALDSFLQHNLGATPPLPIAASPPSQELQADPPNQPPRRPTKSRPGLIVIAKALVRCMTILVTAIGGAVDRVLDYLRERDLRRENDNSAPKPNTPRGRRPTDIIRERNEKIVAMYMRRPQPTQEQIFDEISPWCRDNGVDITEHIVKNVIRDHRDELRKRRGNRGGQSA
jgi:excisionase family DNA binding protein